MPYLPLTNNPEETFSASIFGTLYNFRQLWNTLGFWTIDILDENNNPLIYGVKILAKTSLLSQHTHIPFDLISNDEEDPERDTLDAFTLEVVDRNV